MTTTAVSLVHVLVGVVVLLAASPVLAGWTAALADGTQRWWGWRRVSRSRLLTVAVVAVGLGVSASAGRPWPAWLLFAAGGTVLAIVDAQHHLLPARLEYPLGAAIGLIFTTTALATGEWDRLLRAVLATAVVAIGWSIVALAAPLAFGLGDVRLFTLTGGLLGWTSWTAVLHAEIAGFLLAGVTAVVITRTVKGDRGSGMRVPLGPALIVGSILATRF